MERDFRNCASRLLLCLLAGFAICALLGATVAAESRAPEKESGFKCGTMDHYFKSLQEKGRYDVPCPSPYPCDSPLVRDSWVPFTPPYGGENRAISIRLLFHVFTNQYLEDSTASPAAIADQVATLNWWYHMWGITFTYDFQVHMDPQYRDFTEDEEDGMISYWGYYPDSVLNIYIVDLDTSIEWSARGSFPWVYWEDDDIIIDMDAFGVDRTILVHEMGHCLGLWHTFRGVDEVEGCDGCRETADGYLADETGDYCSETPPTPLDTNSSCAPPGGGDECVNNIPWGQTAVHNFMGYNGENCWDQFSYNQAGRMHCWIREQLVGLQNCDETADDYCAEFSYADETLLNNYSSLSDIVISPRGGFAVCGIYETGGAEWGMLRRVGGCGASDWTVKRLGGSDGLIPTSIDANADGDLLMSGIFHTDSPAGGYNSADVMLYDGCGWKRWDTRWSGNDNSLNNQMACSRFLPDGSTISTGYMEYPYQGHTGVLVKTDAYGEEEWVNTLDSGFAQFPNDVRLASDGGFVLCSGSKLGLGVVKTDDEGEIEWLSRFQARFGNTVIETSTGNVIVAGRTGALEGYADIFVLCLDANGDSLWQRDFGSPYPYDDNAFDIEATLDGNFVVAGYKYSEATEKENMCLIKIRPDGLVLWQRTFEIALETHANAVVATSDGNYVLAGEKEKNGDPTHTVAYLLKVPAEPDFICGDANADGIADVGDAVNIIQFAFAGGSEPNPYIAGDVNCDSIVNITDASYIVNYIFAGGPPPCDPDNDGEDEC